MQNLIIICALVIAALSISLARYLGYGLTGMSERIEAVGGTVTFNSPPGQGFVVTAYFPRG